MAKFLSIPMTLRSRRVSFGAVAAGSLFLSACSSDSQFDIGNMFSAATNIVSSPPATPITLQQAASVPYATISARIGDRSEAMLVLSGYSAAGEQVWAGNGNVLILMRDGRILQTGGTGADLPKLNGDSNNRPLPRSQPGEATRSRWIADFPALNSYSVPIECNAVAQRFETVTILGKGIRTMRVDETCDAAPIAWNFRNTYWISPVSGVVWESVQHIYPGADPLTVKVLRSVSSG
jgi:hypothetical protein